MDWMLVFALLIIFSVVGISGVLVYQKRKGKNKR